MLQVGHIQRYYTQVDLSPFTPVRNHMGAAAVCCASSVFTRCICMVTKKLHLKLNPQTVTIEIINKMEKMGVEMALCKMEWGNLCT